MSNKLSLKYITPAKKLVHFSPLERWIQMDDILGGNYFISTEGRFMTLNKCGLFRSIHSFKHGKRLKINLSDSVNGNQKQFTVATLVLKYFKGGYYKNRKHGFKNNDPFDCRLENLYWFCGFDEGVNYEYLRNLSIKSLSDNDKKVVKFFLTKRIDVLFDLVQSNIHYVIKAIGNRNLNYNVNDNISSIVLKLHDRLLLGNYKPISKKVKYKTVSFISFLVGTVWELIKPELKHVRFKEVYNNESYLDHLKYENQNLINQ